MGKALPEIRPAVFIPLMALAISLVILPTAYASVNVLVSILPEKYFVDRVGGGLVDVSVLVPPGRSPEMYEPTPQQMVRVARADIYFRIGVPFEDRWMDRVSNLSENVRIVDLREGLELRNMDPVGNDTEGRGNGASHGYGTDPHVWMNPLLVVRMAAVIREALSEQDPENAPVYSTGYGRFAGDLAELDREVRQKLGKVSRREFYIYHPSLGYFADAYGLRQIAIEQAGHEPGPRSLQRLVDTGGKAGVRGILVHEGENTRNAETVARALGARVVTFNPLAENYIDNVRSLAGTLQEILQ